MCIRDRFVISSKSGGTIEPRLALRAVRDAVADRISEEELVQHLVAITDPGSMLERQAREEGWAAVFSGQPTVGGRFSALSVFGLLPAALVGIDLEAVSYTHLDVYKRQLCARATEMLVDMMNTETNVNSTYTKVATESASELPTIESAKSAVTRIGKNAR